MPLLRPQARLHRLRTLGRRLLLVGLDALLIPFSVWLSFALRLANAFSPMLMDSLWLLPAGLLVGLPLYALSGQYRSLTRYVGARAIYGFALRNGALVLLLLLLGLGLRLPLPPRSSWILLWMLLTGLTGLVRYTLRDLLLSLGSRHSGDPLRVVIYGAGEAGAQLAASLRLARSHTIEAFLDDAPSLWRRTLYDIPIRPPAVLADLVASEAVDQVLLAIPSLSRRQRRRIVDALQPYGVTVLQVPTPEEITSGRPRIDALRPIAIEELRGRDAVPPDPTLLGPGINGRSVLVTGAGGSIGSELCRQILALTPRRLILLERSEPALYAIDQELRQRSTGDDATTVPLRAVLGSVTDGALLQALLAEEQVQVIFHAAAYKHVPLVEANPLQGLHNNLIGTRITAEAARAAGVEDFVLISTDKAVRPTNVMGASKRAAELVVQALAEDVAAAPPPKTRFTMVRFGNVLGSSGSVVPLFRQQIAAGGPITVTDPEVIRYFMTIPEAAQLVLQAAQLSRGGDLFLLDMGEPVRILDLARQMVQLSGLRLRDEANQAGDIAIVCTGLRPGEKLYEELLIDGASEPTTHPLIYRAREPGMALEPLQALLVHLEGFIACPRQAL
ncbi:MAG: polysaccharide biosynthesis protein [Cyanobacteriota bacterium]